MFVFALAVGCSDDDGTPGEGDDGGAGSGDGTSGTGGGNGGSSGGGTGGSTSTGQSGTGGSGLGGRSGNGGGGNGGSTAVDGGVDGGTGGRCGDVTCDALAKCDESGDEPTCKCPFGYDDVSGFGTKCEEHDPPLCKDDGDCDSDHCVDGVCCKKACDDPPSCHTDDGATCEDGKTCVYPDVDDGESCDDDDLCTDDDECNDGECEGERDDCDDDNICTDDSCDSDAILAGDRCVNDGTGITTTGCADDTLCEMNFACAGNVRGDCEAADIVDCSASPLIDQCNGAACNLGTGTCAAVPVDNDTPCNDDDECNIDEACQAGTCTGGTTRNCNDGNPCTDDDCHSLLPGGCDNPANTDACDDGKDCTTDQCSGGACVGTESCGSEDDECNVGMCDVGGDCVKVPASEGDPCNDNVACTSGSTCDDGTCVDTNSDSACGTGSLSCSGNPRTCVCDTVNGYVLDAPNRVCVPNTNECTGGCGTAACNANSTCSDVNSTCGNRQCTCLPGYNDTDATGQATCVNINECAGTDPCGGAGVGTCSESAPGQGYTCVCSSGYTSIDSTNDGINNPSCGCSLTGTWAEQTTTVMHWSNVDNIEDGTRTTYSWALRTQTLASDGTLQVHTVSCGGTTPDLCGDGSNIPAAAYAQFTTNQLYEGGNAPADDLGPFALSALPRHGAAFDQPQRAVLLGIQLTNPTGTWPSRNELVGTQMTPGTNGAYWTNPDGGSLGITVYVVPHGGIGIDNTVPDPPFAYPATSSVCGGLSYEWLPGLEGGALNPTISEVKRLEIASRAISGLKGNFSAGSCGRISGDVTGPDPDSADTGTNGEMRVDGRFYGCTRVNGAGETGCGTANCSASGCPTGLNFLLGCRGIDFFDCTPPVQVIDDGSFVIKKTDDTTCTQVRAHLASWWTTDP